MPGHSEVGEPEVLVLCQKPSGIYYSVPPDIYLPERFRYSTTNLALHSRNRKHLSLTCDTFPICPQPD